MRKAENDGAHGDRQYRRSYTDLLWTRRGGAAEAASGGGGVGARDTQNGLAEKVTNGRTHDFL